MGELDIKEYDILQGDCKEVLRTLPDDCVDMCVTSPPFFGLRAYGDAEGEIGRETLPLDFVKSLAEVFHEVHRVLKPTGTLWLNLGDTYNGTKTGNTEIYKNPKLAATSDGIHKKEWKGLPPKSLIGIPWRVAFALQDDGWILRSDIIWAKANALPESVEDRVSKSHEYLFMFSKIPSGYYFDYKSIEERIEGADENPTDGEPNTNCLFGADDGFPEEADVKHQKKDPAHYKNLHEDEKGQTNHSFHKSRAEGIPDAKYQMRRKRDVWNVPTRGYAEAHFATYPEELIRPCILAGCPKGGIVLDPFNGAATTGVVALKNRRRYLGIELYPKYIEISRRRIAKETAQQTFDF